jgi:hypothetical protein
MWPNPLWMFTPYCRKVKELGEDDEFLSERSGTRKKRCKRLNV